ncbi:NfeD family protein [Rubinisphaera italica]|uniref:NfeD-like C-terminal domain-containing protein n=1 Tax=Rubinisphaera italica TaxID=2527969 RepID=A0A5C5XAK2_9PLAN|nr:NfeD family protein [Rubinisphaera italica]TWT59808.1 hypothetical protein Pan54_05190 [Rubinisphaera italica]
MDNSFLAIALLALSTVLIIAEVFLPSGGILAIGTFCSLFTAFYFAWLAWWEASPAYFFGFTGFAIVLLPSTLVAAFAVLPYTRFGRRILLDGPAEADVVPFAAEEARLKTYLNRHAVTVTPLTPNGFIMIDNERINASSEGMIVDPHMTVEIVQVKGTRVIVREVSPEDLENRKTQANLNDLDPENSLDFDLPDA